MSFLPDNPHSLDVCGNECHGFGATKVCPDPATCPYSVKESKQLSLDNAKETIVSLCGGNPGGLTVLMELYGLFGEPALAEVAKCEGLRGSEIWLLYKDENQQKLGGFFMDILDGSWLTKLQANRYSALYTGGTDGQG